MYRTLHRLLALTGLMLCPAGLAHAWDIHGRVYCQETGAPLANVSVKVLRAEPGEPLQGSAVTDTTGFYFVPLADSDQCYRAVLALESGQTVVSPASGDYSFCVEGESYEIEQDWIVTCTPRPETPSPDRRCWLTAGGAKFDPLGEKGPQHSWGGNVNPGCSPTAGEGGNWNHVAHHLDLHFQGQAIEVVRCGNVEGIPPGSDSPVTPVNFIEFRGTGRLTGTKGNKADYGTVHFWARGEDRGEPGSHSQRDSDHKDRYFLHVFADPANANGTTLLLVDMDGNPATVDPVTITGGNMQMHASGCDAPPAAVSSAVQSSRAMASSAEGGVDLARGLSLSRTPNPATESALVRFALPRATNLSLVIHDVSGRRVRALAGGAFPSGNHSAVWNLRDDGGRRVAPGMYFMRLSTAEGARRQSLLVTP